MREGVFTSKELIMNFGNACQKALYALLAYLCLSVSANTAFATSEAFACYQIDRPDTPVMGPPEQAEQKETWCYQKLAQPAGSVFIYNVDTGRALVETSLLVEPDGMLTHGSLHAGRTSVRRTHATEFNPFSVPLMEPLHLQRISMLESADMRRSKEEVLRQFLSERAPYISMLVTPGKHQASVNRNDLPWRGYWWPYAGEPMHKPLSKYDKFVQARTGSNPGAKSWEQSYHRDRGVWWHGHCNGWAASAILRAEPQKSKKDPVSGVVFSVSDLKGILAEKDYCAKNSFFGRRYYGRAGDDLKDIYPAQFHQTLTYYIGQIRKPVAIDYYADEVVDNHIISGYSMKIKQTGSNSYSVKAKVKIHKYDGANTNRVGTAPTYTRTYRYTLTTNSSGGLTGGEWVSENPDFLWVPLSSPNCVRSNSKVTNQWVNEILQLQ